MEAGDPSKAKDRIQNEVPPTKRIRPSEIENRPSMMTFKAFLNSQDDNISDEEATAKYSEYKLEFRRQQLKEFFLAHKDDDWFRVKYHPIESIRRKEELREAVLRRATVFMEMYKSGFLNCFSLECEQGDTIEKILDVFVTKLEGRNFNACDSKVIDETDAGTEEEPVMKVVEEDDKSETNEPTEHNKRDYEWIIIDDDGGDDEEDVNTKLEKVNDALQYSEDRKEKLANYDKEEKPEKNRNGSNLQEKNEGESSTYNPNKEEDSGVHKYSPTYSTSKEKEDSGVHKSSPTCNPNKEEDTGKTNEDGQPHNCPLHKSRSIFLRNISSKVSKSEIEEVCRNYPGFLRVWLSEAQPDQHWCRRGFVTFRRDVNIKQICWNLNSVKIKGCEWQAVVNHDLVKRIRTANVLANHKQVIMADMKLATKLIQELDLRAGLWLQDRQQQGQGDTFGSDSGNPLFCGIMDYLVEEAPAEAEELLGQSAVADEYNTQSTDKLKILDKLLLYLRMVHSVDYYNGSQYSQEDEMPNRCGIIHLRGSIFPTEATQQEVDAYIEAHTDKLRPLLIPAPSLSQTELQSLGFKDKEAEVEKFIQTNTQELAQDKFLCPLSGKKFKAPEFVRKHILNKFPLELDNIRDEATYFNNYLLDTKRPELPDNPGILIKKEFDQPYHFHYGGGYRRGFPFGHFGGHGFFMRGRGIPGRGRGGEAFRHIVTYRDLDAPCEPDEMV